MRGGPVPCGCCAGQQLAPGFVFPPVHIAGQGDEMAALISRSDAFADLLNLDRVKLVAQTSESVFLTANDSCGPRVTP